MRNGINEALNINITEILSESEEFEVPKFVVASVRLTFEEFEKISELVNDMTVQIEKIKKARVHANNSGGITNINELNKHKSTKNNIVDSLSLSLSEVSPGTDATKTENGEKYIMASVRVTLEEFKFVMDLMSSVNIEIDGLVDEVKIKPDKVES